MATTGVAGLASLVTEFEGSVYRHVPGYTAKFWPNAIPIELQVPTTSTSKTVYSASTSAAELHVIDDLEAWLSSVQPHQLLSGRIQTITAPYPLAQCSDANHEQHASILIALKHATKTSRICPGADVQVLGLIESGPGLVPDDARVLRFCKMAREFLITRSERRLLHAFHMYNSTMEIWTFDRAGAVSSEAISTTENAHDFARIVARNMSSHAEDTAPQEILKEDDKGVFVELAHSQRLYLEEDAFFRPDCLIGPGTICFKARAAHTGRQNLVVKFVWTETGSAERKLLTLTNTKKVFGILKLEGYKYLGNIASFQHRQELQLGEPYKFHLKNPGDEPSVAVQATPGARPLEQETSNPHVDCSKFDNLQFECLVTSPLGRQLDDFSSMAELITVFRDVTKALESLYLEANILHRDVSRQNIIIVSPLFSDSATGMLIDLDNALDLTEPLPESLPLIGTSGFMACGILGGDDHTYRHDLESLFYVLLWLAICHDGVTSRHIPESSRLHAWMGSPRTGFKWGDIFRIKRADMQPPEFLQFVEMEFREPFRPYLSLAIKFHTLLFPVRNGKIFIGTDPGRAAAERLYGEIIALFESYIYMQKEESEKLS